AGCPDRRAQRGQPGRARLPRRGRRWYAAPRADSPGPIPRGAAHRPTAGRVTARRPPRGTPTTPDRPGAAATAAPDRTTRAGCRSPRSSRLSAPVRRAVQAPDRASGRRVAGRDTPGAGATQGVPTGPDRRRYPVHVDTRVHAHLAQVLSEFAHVSDVQ